jgi:hypothetical protein
MIPDRAFTPHRNAVAVPIYGNEFSEKNKFVKLIEKEETLTS